MLSSVLPKKNPPAPVGTNILFKPEGFCRPRPALLGCRPCLTKRGCHQSHNPVLDVQTGFLGCSDCVVLLMAWHHGILFHLEKGLKLAEVSTVVRTHSPEMASAIGEFVERMLD